MPTTTRATKRARTAAAPSKVFEIAELLELIFLHLPQIDLYVVQRTNKIFKNTIAGSPKLQRQLHYYSFPIGSNPILSDLKSHLKDLHIDTLRYYGIDHPAYLLPGTDISFKKGDIMGWRGKNRVHADGSWRNMAIETLQGCAKAGSVRRNMWDDSFRVPIEGTLGDVVDFLKDLKATRRRLKID